MKKRISLAFLISCLSLISNYSMEEKYDPEETQTQPNPRLTLKAGKFHEQGLRATMEDTSVIKMQLFEDNPNSAVFAIFDGHGGKEVAEFAAQQLAYEIIAESKHTRDGEELLHKALVNISDNVLKNEELANSGSCAILALLIDNILTVANLGDSRTILSRKGKALALSKDHNLENSFEKARVEALLKREVKGKRIGFGPITLGVSRALGNKDWEKCGLSRIPEIRSIDLKQDDAFLILACDGIFEGGMSNQDAVNIVTKALKKFKTKDNAEELAAQELVEIALSGIDNDIERENLLERIRPLYKYTEDRKRHPIYVAIKNAHYSIQSIENPPRFKYSQDNLSAIIVRLR